MSSMRRDIIQLLIWIIIAQLAGIVGSAFTTSNIPAWYALLHKPPFNPPNWIFAPVWETLYIMMGISAYLVWRNWKNNNYETAKALFVFINQLILNAAWSVIFFGQHRILFAFAVIVLLWVVILVNMIQFYKISKPAGWLIVPYILWVSFASVLNLSIWVLNR